MSEITSTDQAMGILDNSDRFAVAVNDGDAVYHLGRDRFGCYVLNTWVSPISERREIRVTREQVWRLIMRGVTRDDENTVRMEPYEETTLKNPYTEE